jgi:hypothetical protein
VRILPRFYARQLEAERLRKIAKITAEAEENAPGRAETVARATLPGDSRRLRGIPVVGGVSGTSPGTDPLGETIRRDSRRTRQRDLTSADGSGSMDSSGKRQ